MPHFRNLPIWTFLASTALALSWLLPNAYPPWLAFHKDAWLAGVLLLVGLVVQLRRTGPHSSFLLDPLSVLLLSMVAVTLMQWTIGMIHFGGHVALAVAYFGGAALAIIVGREWARKDVRQFGNFIFSAFLVAALGSAFFILVQWLRIDEWTGIWIQELGRARQPFGNLNQPNNAATLLVLGMVAASWFAKRRAIGVAIWFVTCSFLAFSVAVTGSRIGYLSFSSLVLMALVIGWTRRSLDKIWIAALLHLLLMFMIWVMVANADWGEGVNDSTKVFERDLTSIRLYLWRAYAHAALTQPWLGFGFEQGVLTQKAAGELGYELNGLYTWSHNGMLDVATWFGLPMALAVFAFLLWFIGLWARASDDAYRWIFVAAIYPVVLHGMVELPLAFAYFLLPVGLLTGAALASIAMPSIKLSRGLVITWTLTFAGLLGTIIYDYVRIESAFYTWRFERARIGKNHPQDIPRTLILNQFEALLVGLRGSADTLSLHDVDEFEKSIIHDPSIAAIQHLAEVRVRQNDPVGAQRAADLASLTAQPAVRKALLARGAYLADEDARFAVIRWGK